MVESEPGANLLPSFLLALPLWASLWFHLPSPRLDSSHRLVHYPSCANCSGKGQVSVSRGTSRSGALPRKRARGLWHNPGANSISAFVLVHLRFDLNLLDQFNYLLGEWVGSGDDPVLTLAKEDDIPLVLG